jgi:CRISPR-associated endonuclease Csn1
MGEMMHLNRKAEVPKPTDLNYRIGLDIGIASVGWAVLENNTHDEPFRIIDLGVRIFDTAEQPKTGASLALPRREARSARRRLRRRGHRLERIKKLFEAEGLINIEEFEARYKKTGLPDVYKLRYEGLDRRLTNDELAQVLLHIAKHRGFKSTSKAADGADSDTGEVKKSISANKALMQEKGYRTVGEMIYLDEKFHTDCPWNENGYILTPRNKSGDYKHTVLRDMLADEVMEIFKAQRALGNDAATEELERAYLDIMLSQRSFDLGPGAPSKYAMEGFEDRVGLCTFEGKNGEKRAPKAAYTSEFFVALEKINHTKIVYADGNTRFFTDDERYAIIALMHRQQTVKYTAVRRAIGLAEEDKFYNLNYSPKSGNKKSPEDTDFVKMENYHKIRKALGEEVVSEHLSPDKIKLYDDIARILTLYKNDDSRIRRLAEYDIASECYDALLEMSPSKFHNLSLKAMGKIIPFLLEGNTYDKACELAGYDFRAENNGEKSVLLKGKNITNIVNDITNPVVRRSVSQTIKVINAIILEYGSPQAVNIELAREMSKDFDERRKIKSDMEAREKENDKVLGRVREYKPNPTGQDIVKFRLWEEQGGVCLYSGEKIDINDLFSSNGGYDVDHILPYSITFDDSYRNKVLVKAAENRQKGNRTPYEYIMAEKGETAWNKYETLVKNTVKDYKKQLKLLKKHISDEEKAEFKERNLTDTKYITRIVYNMIRQNLVLKPYLNLEGKRKKQVMAVNGAITHYLSKRWGLAGKDRRTDTHHAQDAVVIACTTDGMINRISRYSKGRELAYSRGFGFVDEETGEILNRDNFSREDWDEKFGVRLPMPWEHFVDELDIRMSRYSTMGEGVSSGTSPREFILSHRDVFNWINYPEWMFVEGRPGRRGVLDGIFVSRMPNHKVSGQAHEETIRSAKYYEDGGSVFETGGYVVTKKSIQDIKLKDGEIKEFFNPDSDRLLYEALVDRLNQYGNDPKKAFAEPFHKPKSDGTPGPVVKKIKVFEKQTSGVLVRDGNGIAANGSMVRIDVFCEENKGKKKYYFVPIYTADVVKKRLPNRAATANKMLSEWRMMNDENFIFSLYSRDLIYIESDKGVQTKDIDNVTGKVEKMYAYYTGADTSTASIAGKLHDSSAMFRGLGIQSLRKLQKCQIDVLGNISFVSKEKRMTFN